MKKYISIIFSLLAAFAFILSGTLAWQSIGQTARNITLGSGEILREITLEKQDQNGNPVSGAVFYLYRAEDNGTSVLVGGPYTTGSGEPDENGKPTVQGAFTVSALLRSGTYFFVEETPPSGYTWITDVEGEPIYQTSFTVSNGEDTPIYVRAYDIILPREDGSLLIHNIVKNADGSPLTEDQQKLQFTYHINFSETEGKYAYTLYPSGVIDPVSGNVEHEKLGMYDLNVIKGTAGNGDILYLRHGETIIFHDLPNGMEYYITQDPMPEYVTETITPRGIIDGDKAQAIFINTYVPEKTTGTLTIRKNKVADATDDDIFYFFATVGGVEYTVPLKSGEKYQISGIPLGSTYTVRETNSGRYRAEIQQYSGTIQTIDEVELNFVNAPAEEGTGSLKIEKNIPGEKYNETEFEFEVTIGEKTESFKLQNGQSKTFDNIPAGTVYTVTEVGTVSPYIPVIGSVSGTVNGDGRNIAVVMENRKLDTCILEISKSVINPPVLQDGESAPKFPFTLQLDIPKSMFSAGTELILTETLPNSEYCVAVGSAASGESPESSADARIVNMEIFSTSDTFDTFHITFDLQAGEYVRFIIPYGVLYSVREKIPERYTAAYSGNYHGTAVNTWEKERIGVTNTYLDPGQETEMQDISVTKIWMDEQNKYGVRPKEIEVYLWANNEIIRTAKITGDSEADKWEHTFENLPVYKITAEGRKEKITYTISEKEVPKYTPTIENFTIANTYTPDEPDLPDYIEIEVRKRWVDDRNQNGVRPKSIEVRLSDKNGNKIQTQYLTEQNDWTVVFTIDDPVYDANNMPAYTITEVFDHAQYSSEVGQINPEGNNRYTCDIVNTYEDGGESGENTVTITLKKYWEYAENDTNRPQSITVQLCADGAPIETVTLNRHSVGNTLNEWTYVFDNNGVGYPKIGEDGKEIQYTITEPKLPGGYVSDSNTTYGQNSILVEMTNTYTYRSIEGEKLWYNGTNKTVPDKITLHVYRNGDYYQKVVVEKPESGDRWLYSVTGLPVFDVKGNRYKYTIYEEVPDGYFYYVDEHNNIHNIHYTDDERYVLIEGTKYWITSGNTNASSLISPVIIGLYADGKLIDQKTVGDKKTESGTIDWTYSFGKRPRFTEKGQYIEYTVREIKGVEDFDCYPIDGTFDLKNVYNPEMEISGIKTWDHRSNPKSQRPKEITVILYRNGVWFAQDTVDAAEGWKYLFAGLSRFDENGNPYTYSIDEMALEGYVAKVDGYNIHNTYAPVITVSGQKFWNHRDRTASEWPEYIIVKLMADGKQFDWCRVSAQDDWKYAFHDLPKFTDSGREIKYEIEEELVNGYSIVKKGYDLLNVYDPVITISGTKRWEHRDNPLSERPVSTVVYLYADGKQLAEATVSEKERWKYTFADLPVYGTDGHRIKYTIGEESVDDYVMTADGFDLINTYNPIVVVQGTKTWLHRDNPKENWPKYADVYLYANGAIVSECRISEECGWSYIFADLPSYTAEGKRITYTIGEKPIEDYITTVDGYNLTNIHDSKIDISGQKFWEHRDNPVENQPKSLVIYLFADGVLYTQTEITADDNWQYTFRDVPLYNSEGRKIVYTVDERVPEGYTKAISGYDLTNVYDPKITLSGTKSWIHSGNPLTKQPDAITVSLFADGALVRQSVVTAETDWGYTFFDLPKYDADGSLIQYTIDEIAVESYSKEIVGLNLINTYVGEPDDDGGDLPDIPQTGDDMNLIPWIVLFIMSTLGVGVLLYILWQITDSHNNRRR